MRLRRAFALLGAVLLAFVCFMLYLMMDLTFPTRHTSAVQDIQENKWLHFEGRLERLEKTFNKHHETVGQIRKAISLLSSSTSSPKSIQLDPPVFNQNLTPAYDMIYDKQNCPILLSYAPKTNVQMLELYKELKFDNPDGGAWKQGWNIVYDVKQWNRHHKLKIFVIPHSHNDPGWLKTFEEYYIQSTKNILNNMVTKLAEDSKRKFIWAEISYLATWWNDIDDYSKNRVRKYLKSGQLEIVTGGWVMNDEANTHWTSMLRQLSEGHQWLQRHLNYTPRSSWSIDPFGQSPTMADILRGSGFENLLIQRVHYSIKKHLASRKQLEFKWKQIWDNSEKTALFTHMMPFYSYDVPHTCGPDPKICCQFDFQRLPGHGITCPWRISPQTITENNVAQKAELLLDQYRRKAQLYHSNVLLVPLGDDFRYAHPTEWNNQYINYQMLFDYMNNNPGLNVEAKFGTLSDYFDALREERMLEDFPTLTGDFFTYADRDDHYWSGYYTSRPFYKRMERMLLSYVRSADIILTFAFGSDRDGAKLVLSEEAGLVKMMKDARENLAMFQHHDGITGTARDHVVIDYGRRMLSSIINCQHVLQQAVNVLLNGPSSGRPGLEIVHYNVDDTIRTHDSLPDRFIVMIGKGMSFNMKKVVVFNSLTFTRHEVVKLLVSTQFVQVTDLLGNIVKCQVSPVFEHSASVSESKYEVVFIASVPALSLVTYSVQAIDASELTEKTVLSSIKVFNHYNELRMPMGFSKVEVTPSSQEFKISNHRLTTAFNHLGLLKAIRIGSDTIPVHLDFARYGVRDSNERSGGYLFLPDGDAQPVNIESTIVKVIEGPIYSQVIVQLPKVLHTVTLYSTPGADGLGLEITNIVDISETSNYELIMRLSTNIKSGSEFFTDLNGYQVLRRIRFPKLPIQANYYPIPTMAFIEDKSTRLSVVTGTPLGCSSLKEGQLEIMMDRRLNQDDNRGLGQGVTDNHPTKHTFRIMLEKRLDKCQTTSDDHPAAFPTLTTHVGSQTLLNPLIKLLRNDDMDIVSERGYSAVMDDLGVDFSMPILQTKIVARNYDDNIGMVLHRQLVDVCFSDKTLLQQFPLSHGTVNVNDVLKFATEVRRASLTYNHVGDPIEGKSEMLCPMESQAYLVRR